MAKELTQEEREKRNAYKREWARAKAAKLKADKEIEANKDNLATEYKQMKAAYETLTAKYAEMQKICQSYATRATKAEELLQRATLEYNARTKYMLDCVKHAYLSIQFAEASAEKDRLGGNND